MTGKGLCIFWEQSWFREEQHRFDRINYQRCLHCPGDAISADGKTPFSEGCRLKGLETFEKWLIEVYKNDTKIT